MHTAGAPKISIDQSGFSRRESCFERPQLGGFQSESYQKSQNKKHAETRNLRNCRVIFLNQRNQN